MAKVGRFHGALLVESNNIFYLVGGLKEPAKYEEAGFVNPGEFEPSDHKFIKLEVSGAPEVKAPYFTTRIEDEELTEKLFDRLVIKRNGSVSVRLWDLVFDADEYDDEEIIDAAWLIETPEEIWEIVRDVILKC